MNKDLRHHFRCNQWNSTEFLLSYLRGKNCFQSIAGKPNANPYWYGSILDYNTLEKELTSLIKAKSIKKQRLLDISATLSNDLNSPIVRLTGMTMQRFVLKQYEK
jgi:hypothetical protein